ncbi:MAG TPA: hypothetical protein VGI60_00365 [Chthoniobacterales bacterium]|jgi:hypothetical protein
MKKLLISFLIWAVGLSSTLCALGQDTYAGIDLLYPQLAHPREDATVAIKRRDFRFVIVNRSDTDVPGLDKHQSLKWIYGTKFVRRPFRIFATKSQDFSFNIRARAYAEEYNRMLLHHLLPDAGP